MQRGLEVLIVERYITRLKDCQTQEDVDKVVKAISNDESITLSQMNLLMQDVKDRRAMLPPRNP